MTWSALTQDVASRIYGLWRHAPGKYFLTCILLGIAVGFIHLALAASQPDRGLAGEARRLVRRALDAPQAVPGRRELALHPLLERVLCGESGCSAFPHEPALEAINSTTPKIEACLRDMEPVLAHAEGTRVSNLYSRRHREGTGALRAAQARAWNLASILAECDECMFANASSTHPVFLDDHFALSISNLPFGVADPSVASSCAAGRDACRLHGSALPMCRGHGTSYAPVSWLSVPHHAVSLDAITRRAVDGSPEVIVAGNPLRVQIAATRCIELLSPLDEPMVQAYVITSRGINRTIPVPENRERSFQPFSTSLATDYAYPAFSQGRVLTSPYVDALGHGVVQTACKRLHVPTNIESPMVLCVDVAPKLATLLRRENIELKGFEWAVVVENAHDGESVHTARVVCDGSTGAPESCRGIMSTLDPVVATAVVDAYEPELRAAQHWRRLEPVPEPETGRRHFVTLLHVHEGSDRVWLVLAPIPSRPSFVVLCIAFATVLIVAVALFVVKARWSQNSDIDERAFLRSLPQALVLLTNDGVIVCGNDAAMEVLGRRLPPLGNRNQHHDDAVLLDEIIPSEVELVDEATRGRKVSRSEVSVRIRTLCPVRWRFPRKESDSFKGKARFVVATTAFWQRRNGEIVTAISIAMETRT